MIIKGDSKMIRPFTFSPAHVKYMFGLFTPKKYSQSFCIASYTKDLSTSFDAINTLSTPAHREIKNRNIQDHKRRRIWRVCNVTLTLTNM